jgi:hypothetical protein
MLLKENVKHMYLKNFEINLYVKIQKLLNEIAKLNKYNNNNNNIE